MNYRIAQLSQKSNWNGLRCCQGVTLLELMIVTVILAFLTTVGSGAYSRYIDRARIARTTTELAALSVEIKKFDTRNVRLPDNLAELGLDPQWSTDPWGNPYQYRNLGPLVGVGGARKDHNNVQLNQDYDLYSLGNDGLTNQTFTATASQDDIVRALSGQWFGTAEEYSQNPGGGGS